MKHEENEDRCLGKGFGFIYHYRIHHQIEASIKTCSLETYMYEKQKCKALWQSILSTFDLATQSGQKASNISITGHLSEADILDPLNQNLHLLKSPRWEALVWRAKESSLITGILVKTNLKNRRLEWRVSPLRRLMVIFKWHHAIPEQKLYKRKFFSRMQKLVDNPHKDVNNAHEGIT